MKYQVLLLIKATPKWLGLSKTYRERIFNDVLFPLFIEYTNQLHIKLINAEAFHSSVSDIINIETESLERYYIFLQQLKSSRVFSEEYFELQDVIVGIENGFRKFNEESKKQQSVIMN